MPLPFVIHSKRSGSATETAALDLVATVFDELVAHQRPQGAAEAADGAVPAEAVGIPVYFLPYRLSTKRTGYSGSGAFKIHILPHPYPTVNVPPAIYSEVWGPEGWAVPPKRFQNVQVHIRAAAVRRIEDMNVCLSKQHHNV